MRFAGWFWKTHGLNELADKGDFLLDTLAEHGVRLAVSDNGSGFPEAGSFDHFSLAHTGAGPRSIIERVGSFRGAVDLVSSADGAIVSILIPLGRIDA